MGHSFLDNLGQQFRDTARLGLFMFCFIIINLHRTNLPGVPKKLQPL